MQSLGTLGQLFEYVPQTRTTCLNFASKIKLIEEYVVKIRCAGALLLQVLKDGLLQQGTLKVAPLSYPKLTTLPPMQDKKHY